ncbi:MAG: hypothetical protein AAF078_06975 [Planctomycetota bacterium]
MFLFLVPMFALAMAIAGGVSLLIAGVTAIGVAYARPHADTGWVYPVVWFTCWIVGSAIDIYAMLNSIGD